MIMDCLIIKDIKFLDQYKLDILLSNGHGILYDLAPKIKTARFQILEDQAIYYQGHLTPDGMIRWQGGTELDLDEIVLDLINQGSTGISGKRL